MTEDRELLSLCCECRRQVAGEAGAASVKDALLPFHCALCFGILDPLFIQQVSEAAEAQFSASQYDSSSFILALNLPFSQMLRETLIRKRFPHFNGILSDTPFKLRNINAYIRRLQEASGLRPTLNSDLQMTVSFENDEFTDCDRKFLTDQFPHEFCHSKKRRRYENGNGTEEIELTKVKLANVVGRLSEQHAINFPLHQSPTRPCTFSFAFERDPIYIAGRYCKYSRSLPQSPWTAEEEEPKKEGHSVSEKVSAPVEKLLGAESVRFIASGREDMDVRMLGTGRPFVLQLINCRYAKRLHGELGTTSLSSLRSLINTNIDVTVSDLVVVSRSVGEQLSIGQEDKIKHYSAFCYSTLPVDRDRLLSLSSRCPFEISQQTPVRVMKRRALLSRPRTIHSLQALPLDPHHFLIKLSTQAGTYVKEFVHGDFGRTRPSLADLLCCERGEVDIVELDVEGVELEWPPADSVAK